MAIRSETLGSKRIEINKERLTVNLRQEEGTKQTDGEKECKTGIQPKPMKKKCICAQVRETDIQMDRWNMLDRGRHQRAGKMVGFLS